MKIIISERQVKTLSENQFQYTEEKVLDFYNEGKNFLEKLKKHIEISAKHLLLATINDVLSEEKIYRNQLEIMKKLLEKSDNIAEKLNNIVEYYDMTERPEIIKKLEFEIVNEIDNSAYQLSKLKTILEEFISSANELKEFIPQ